MLFKSKEVIVSEQSFVVKDRNQCLKVEGWGRDTVRVTYYPNHKGFDPKQGIEKLGRNVLITATVTETSD